MVYILGDTDACYSFSDVNHREFRAKYRNKNCQYKPI